MFPKAKTLFSWLADQFGTKVAENVVLQGGKGRPNRHARRAQEAWERRKYFKIPGRKLRNLAQRKYVA